MTNPVNPWPGVRFSPEALDMFCRDFGECPDQAAADVEALNAEMAAGWAAYQAAHPGATFRDFALEQIEDAARELALLVGNTPERAREVARRARAEAVRARP